MLVKRGVSFFSTRHCFKKIAIGSMVLVYMLTWLGYIQGSMSTYIAAPWILWDKTSIQCGCSWLTRMLCFQPLTSIVHNVIQNMNWICPPRTTLKSIFIQQIATRSRTSCPEVSPFPLPRPSRGVAAAFGTREKLSVCTVDTADDTV